MSSYFRHGFEAILRPVPGRPVEWPYLLRRHWEDEIVRLRQLEKPYAGEVFVNRDKLAEYYATRTDQAREDLSVYRLFRRVHKEGDGSLMVGDEPIWLVTCKVPNQGKHSIRVADLLGVRKNGSIVVFECKQAGNKSDSPLFALLEALDYLGHLLQEQNLERLSEGLCAWRSMHADGATYTKTPVDFADVVIDPEARHGVIVLAPRHYFDFHQQSSTGVDADWIYLSDRYWDHLPRSLSIDFAECGYPMDGEQMQHSALIPLKPESLGRFKSI